MNVALIMYGHMRTYHIAHEGLKKFFLDPYKPDVFIHTWDEVEAKTKTWHKEHMRVQPLDVDEVMQMYEPREIVVEHQPEVDDNRVTPNNNISYVGQKFMLESLRKVNSLRRMHDEEYDLVVKIRPDIKLLKPFPLPDPTPGVVFTGSNLHGGNRSACDIINVATPADMDRIAQVADHFDEFYVERVLTGELQHSGFVDYMTSLGLRIEWLPCLYRNHWNIIRRKNG